MERSLNYFLSFTMLVLCVSCSPSPELYKKTFTQEEIDSFDKMRWFGGAYQGTAAEKFLLEEGIKHLPEKASFWRELGIAGLKRGIPYMFFPYYEKAVQYDSIEWLGYRGYCILYFNRDYERALKDFNDLDPLTPNFVDHPQAQSIDYMRGICHLRLNQHDKALEYFDLHLKTEIDDVGEDYVSTYAFLYKGITHHEMGDKDAAQKAFEWGLRVHDSNADLEYWLAKCLLEKGENKKALVHIQKAKDLFKQGYKHSRNYTEDFYQTYMVDILDIEGKISNI